jgi:hypothetical protein
MAATLELVEKVGARLDQARALGLLPPNTTDAEYEESRAASRVRRVAARLLPLGDEGSVTKLRQSSTRYAADSIGGLARRTLRTPREPRRCSGVLRLVACDASSFTASL